ncbi:MAG: 50S ribosomal protein L19e [Candidatus Pacearchaeota archaeon]
MNLKKKKDLAARTLKLGKERVILDPNRIDEIKEAITKQDIRDLVKDGAIRIAPKKGRKKKQKRKTRRRAGKIKIRVKKRKENYVKLTRKLRKYLKELRNQNKISRDKYYELRRRIKMKEFKSKRHLKESLV